MVKIGVIGCGYWGPQHARNFHDLPDTQLSWISDLRPERLQHMRTLYPYVCTTTDYREVLDSDVDGVVVATSVGSHYKLGSEALEAGKHVLIEKPLAATVAEAEELVGQGLLFGAEAAAQVVGQQALGGGLVLAQLLQGPLCRGLIAQ